MERAGIRPSKIRLALLLLVLALGTAVAGIETLTPSASSARGNVASAEHRLLTATAQAEACALRGTGRYTSNLEDLNLLAADSAVIDASVNDLSLQVSVAVSGKAFFARAVAPGFDDYIQVTAELVDQGGGPRVPMRCPFSKAKVLGALRLGRSIGRVR